MTYNNNEPKKKTKKVRKLKSINSTDVTHGGMD